MSSKICNLDRYLLFDQISALSSKNLYRFCKISVICKISVKWILSSSAKDILSKIICYIFTDKDTPFEYICYLLSAKIPHIICFLVGMIIIAVQMNIITAEMQTIPVQMYTSAVQMYTIIIQTTPSMYRCTQWLYRFISSSLYRCTLVHNHYTDGT